MTFLLSYVMYIQYIPVYDVLPYLRVKELFVGMLHGIVYGHVSSSSRVSLAESKDVQYARDKYNEHERAPEERELEDHSEFLYIRAVSGRVVVVSYPAVGPRPPVLVMNERYPVECEGEYENE